MQYTTPAYSTFNDLSYMVLNLKRHYREAMEHEHYALAASILQLIRLTEHTKQAALEAAKESES